jgi:signal transduction histidine kinase
VLEDSRSFIPNEKKVLIVFEPNREPLFVQADRARMFEVLSNLIRNAIKFIEKEGTITIRVEKNDNGYALVSIKDTRIGIAPGMMPRLFTKFATTSGQGTGLGLFISKSIVEAHGGEIWAENNSDGKGATFSFTLPVASDDNNNLEQSKDQAPQTLYQKLTPSRQ